MLHVTSYATMKDFWNGTNFNRKGFYAHTFPVLSAPAVASLGPTPAPCGGSMVGPLAAESCVVGWISADGYF
jgi:hypothetical protein